MLEIMIQEAKNKAEEAIKHYNLATKNKTKVNINNCQYNIGGFHGIMGAIWQAYEKSFKDGNNEEAQKILDAYVDLGEYYEKAMNDCIALVNDLY